MNPSSRDFTEAPKALSIYSSRLAALCILAFSALLITSIASAQTQMQVYGVWHCYSDACSWASVQHDNLRHR